MSDVVRGLKPYYKWNTFNTMSCFIEGYDQYPVLNLIINGIPSIPKKWDRELKSILKF